MTPSITCDVLVMAHNEATNIRSIVSSVLDQAWTDTHRLGSCVIVSTTSTDETDHIVAAMAEQDARVTLVTIPERRGKVADVNTGVEATDADVLVIMDADIDISDACLPHLLAPFESADVGLTAAWRAVASSDHPTTAWRVGRLVAEVHNELDEPKAGQVLAIRRELAAVNERVTVDDAFQQWRAESAGLLVARVPEAVVISKPPATLRDVVRQRRRVVAQYQTLRQVTGVLPPTHSVRKVVAAAFRTETVRHERRWDILCAAAAAEAAARVLGWSDARWRRRDYRTWDAVASTKPL